MVLTNFVRWSVSGLFIKKILLLNRNVSPDQSILLIAFTLLMKLYKKKYLINYMNGITVGFVTSTKIVDGYSDI